MLLYPFANDERDRFGVVISRDENVAPESLVVLDTYPTEDEARECYTTWKKTARDMNFFIYMMEFNDNGSARLFI